MTKTNDILKEKEKRLNAIKAMLRRYFWYELDTDARKKMAEKLLKRETRLLREAVEAERQRVVEKVLNKKRYKFNPVGGISNMEYINVSDIKKLSQQEGK